MFCAKLAFGLTCLILIQQAFCVNYSPNYHHGRDVMVHLFEWKFIDIARECENYLGPNGFGGVQVSPVNENAIVEGRPWYERYQPISYKIITRSGNENEFVEMIERCNRAGVRIYVDVLPNHMTGKLGLVTGTGGSTADVGNRSYPAVPYTVDDFHPSCNINNYNDPEQVRNCELAGLPDLNQTNPHVREKISEFMNRLIDIGVAGFRIDAAKHMWPNDLEAIYGNLKNLSTKFFKAGTQPFIYQEVIDLGGEAVKKSEYTHLGAVTEFKYSAEIGRIFGSNNSLNSLKDWGVGFGLLESKNALVFVDNHDNQRGHGAGGKDILTYKQRREYVMASAFMLAHPYGTVRVMSSYDFSTPEQGPPADKNLQTVTPIFNRTTGQCLNGWICEHRWPEIRNMIKFRNAVKNKPLTSFWSNSSNQIAFCRGDKGFIAFNNDENDMKEELFTCLKPGVYCDIITGGQRKGRKCTGAKVVVDKNGKAVVNVPRNIGVIAIHVEK